MAPRKQSEGGRWLSLAWHLTLELLYLAGQAMLYLGRMASDLADSVRLLQLARRRKKFPQRAADAEAAMARLRERKSARWSSWEGIGRTRRMEIQAAAGLLVLGAAVIFHGYVSHGDASREQEPVQSASVHVGSKKPRAASVAAKSGAPPEFASADLARFRAECRNAKAGQWSVYGVKSYSSARADVDEAKAEVDSARRDLQAASGRYASAPRTEDARRALVAAQQRLAAADEKYATASRELNNARSPVPRPVLARGELYDWDDFKVMSPVVINTGGAYRMWYVGCHFVAEDYTCAVGHARSSDGVVWSKTQGPVLVLKDRALSRYLHSIAAVRVGNEYSIWYAVDSHGFGEGHCTILSYASSHDGLHWDSPQEILRANCRNTGHLWPEAFADGGTLHLWYADFDSGRSLMHLLSADGRHWRSAGATSFHQLGLPPGQMRIVSRGPSGWHALFASPDRDELTALQSSDGSNWQRADGAPQLKELFPGAFSFNRLDQPVELVESSGTWMWFGVSDRRDGSEAIGVAFQNK